jgi:hypothetical protein
MKMASFSFLVKKKQFPEEVRLVRVGGHVFVKRKHTDAAIFTATVQRQT